MRNKYTTGLIAMTLLTACGPSPNNPQPSPSPSLSPSATPTPGPSVSPIPGETPTPVPSATGTPVGPSATPTPLPTATPELSPAQQGSQATVTGSYYSPAQLAPTAQRIQGLNLPAGFSISKWAEISNPRMMSVAADGTVYVSQRDPGTLSMLRDSNNDGAADIQKVVAEKEKMHGVFVNNNQVFMATIKEVMVADRNADGSLGTPRTLITDLPDAGQHPNRTLAVHNGQLYITIGSVCNVCVEPNPEHATIVKTSTDGGPRTIVASGLRNTIGFGWHPGNDKLFGMDHGSDFLGDEQQPEELNEIIEGQKYGWPYVHGNGILHPHVMPPAALGLTNEDWDKQSKRPVATYTSHAAPMQMQFYTGSMFPAEYRNDAFVAMRGSWNRNPPSGYELARVRFDAAGNPQRIESFVSGFLVKGGGPSGNDGYLGRLAGVAQLPDGSMLVSDDTNNVIYRISYGTSTQPPIMQRENISLSLPETASSKSTLAVTAAAFANGSTIPNQYSAYFQNISPALSWSGVPSEAKSIVLMMEDPDAGLKPVTHWLMANLPPTITNLPENVSKDDKYGEAIQGSNISGKPGYFGPRPPVDDKPHTYHFQIFALDTTLNLPVGYNRQALLDAMRNHVLAKGEVTGVYQRKVQ